MNLEAELEADITDIKTEKADNLPFGSQLCSLFCNMFRRMCELPTANAFAQAIVVIFLAQNQETVCIEVHTFIQTSSRCTIPEYT